MHPILDALFALAVLAFIVVTAVVSIGAFVRSGAGGTQSGDSSALGPGVRAWYIAHLQPIEDRCVQWAISPSALSCAQLVASAVVGYLFSCGMLFTAGWLLLAGGSLDVVDGRVARRSGGGSRRGAFLDSVIDRYADGFAFLGLAIYFRDSWVLWAALFAMLGGLMVSYTRARAEGLGAECKVGLLQRPERSVLLGFGAIFDVLFDHIASLWMPAGQHPVLVVAIVALAVLANVTAAQRIVHVWRILGEAPHA